MKYIIAGVLSAILLWIAPTPTPANLNNSTDRTRVQTVQAKANETTSVHMRQEVHMAHEQEPSPQPPKTVEPEKKVSAATPVQKPQGCEAYRPLVSKYDWNVKVAMAVMRAESGCNPNALSPTHDRGLMQINSCHAAKVNYDLNSLYDPATNMRVAYSVYLSQGWRGWSAYKNGSYLKFL